MIRASRPLAARLGLLTICVEPSFDVRRALALDDKHIVFCIENARISRIPQGGGGPLKPLHNSTGGGGEPLNPPNGQHREIITKSMKFLWKY